MDEPASTTDCFGCVVPDGAPGAKPLNESSPATAAATDAAAAAAATSSVEVASAPSREGTRGRLKRSQRDAKHTRPKLRHERRRIWVNVKFGTI